MGQTFSNLLVHVIYSTKGRAPLITAEIRPRLYAYIGGHLRKLECTMIEIGGVADHVHILVRYPPRLAVAEIVSKIKSNSSRWTGDELGEFSWQGGYSAFSVSESAAPQVRRYIAGQEEHHRRVSFKEEVLAFLRQHGMEYDERYIWD